MNELNVMSIITKKSLKKDDFTEEQLKYLDIENLSTTSVLFRFNNIKDLDSLDKAIADIIKYRTNLPMNYLEPIAESCEYISKKDHNSTSKEPSIKDSDIVIQPLHSDIFNLVVPSIPINQKIPLGTMVDIDIETPFDIKNGRIGIWSNDLKLIGDVNEIFKYTDYKYLCNRSIHIGIIDLGSSFHGKFKVSKLDRSIMNSHMLFSFKRPLSNDRNVEQTLVIWVYDHLSVTIKEILKMILDDENASEDVKILCIKMIKSLT